MAWSVGSDAAWQQRIHKEERAARRTPAYMQQVEDRPASSPPMQTRQPPWQLRQATPLQRSGSTYHSRSWMRPVTSPAHSSTPSRSASGSFSTESPVAPDRGTASPSPRSSPAASPCSASFSTPSRTANPASTSPAACWVLSHSPYVTTPSYAPSTPFSRPGSAAGAVRPDQMSAAGFRAAHGSHVPRGGLRPLHAHRARRRWHRERRSAWAPRLKHPHGVWVAHASWRSLSVQTPRIHTLSPSSGLYSQPPEVRCQASPSLSARSHPENRPQQRTASQLRSPRDWLLPGQ